MSESSKVKKVEVKCSRKLFNQKRLGMDRGDVNPSGDRRNRISVLNLKLGMLGLPGVKVDEDNTRKLFEDILGEQMEHRRLIDFSQIGIDKRINAFFSQNFKRELKVLSNYLEVDSYGLARELSLPIDSNHYQTQYIDSYRIKQGILHNPKNAKRTTAGSFHLVEGLLKVPFDKKLVPKEVFEGLYTSAINPPKELLELPFTATSEEKARTFVSLFLRPIVSPEVPGASLEKTMEVRIVVPGQLVANLDFAESIFGNGGCSLSCFSDSALDVTGWSGHSGYILLAPHLCTLKKKELGLPHFDKATERQKSDGMCYKDDNELYNDGSPFKITARDASGVAVTLIADNYFGYTKKEVKTLITFAANLYGNVEEEHAGGTIAFKRVNLGNYAKKGDKNLGLEGYSFKEVKEKYGDLMTIQKGDFGIDKKFKNVIYLPSNIKINLDFARIQWRHESQIRQLKLLPDHYYILPNGCKITIEKHPIAPSWKLILTEAEGLFCHKPCTVSGGGKSEISKSIENSIVYGTFYVDDFEKDLAKVREIIDKNFGVRWKGFEDRGTSRKILSTKRTLGSVIKLLTPSSKYKDEFNDYLRAIPNRIKALVFMVKRFHRESWDDNWEKYFRVDKINGKTGNEIKIHNRKIRPSYLRVGFGEKSDWRLFKVRMDFIHSKKIQMEDDISASITLPKTGLKCMDPLLKNKSFKFTANCEYRFFQRPDDAIIKGYDKQAEKDLSVGKNLFVTNFQPLRKKDVQLIKEDVLEYVKYTRPVVEHIEEFLHGKDEFCIVSSEPRISNGEKCNNPRYLEIRRDFLSPIDNYLADLGVRLKRKIPLKYPVLTPVHAVLAGRRNNPPGMENGKKILPLSVYNPIHYQHLPELFMDFISSLTGKSPSTTGAGSEGALTKGPFNMLLPIYDLNAAFLYYVLSEISTFTTPAGYIGDRFRVDHDISMLIPEIWCRLTEEERNPEKLIKEGSFEKIQNFEYKGSTVQASRLGYRITEEFLYKYMGKIFDEPSMVFTEEMLRPELQNLEAFVDGVNNIVNCQKKIGQAYLKDGTVDHAIPPLKALIHIMATGKYNDWTLESNEFRNSMSREVVIDSEWYKLRLLQKQKVEEELMKRKISALEEFVCTPMNKKVVKIFAERLEVARSELKKIQSKEFLDNSVGTIGANIVY